MYVPRKWEGLGTALWSGSHSAEVGGGSEPRRSAWGGRGGGSGLDRFCRPLLRPQAGSSHFPAPFTVVPGSAHCPPRTPSLRSGGLPATGAASASLALSSPRSPPAFLAILSAGGSMEVLISWGSSSPTLLPVLCSGQWPALLRCVLGADLPPHPSL